MQQQYQITVPWNLLLRNCSFDAEGLITLCELLPGAALPTDTLRFQSNCILNKLGTGLYQNAGTPASPSFAPLGGGAGNPAGLDTWVQYNNAGVFGADAGFVRDPAGTFFGIRSTISLGVVTQFTQDTNILGIGIDGMFNAYSDDNFATYFLGVLAGDFTAVGGNTNSMIVGYQDIGGGAIANTNYGYDSVTGTATVRLEASTVAMQVRIELETDGVTQALRIDFGGGQFYNLPALQATVPGSVLTDVGANGILSWEAPGAATITIGDPISGGTTNRILFENGSNDLSESSDFTYTDSTGEFKLSFAGSNRLFINPASNQYYIGNGGTGDTLIEVLDTGGGTSVIRNWVTGSFIVEQGNAGPRLIDGNTGTFNLYLGDVGSNANGTVVEILDSIKTIQIISHTSGGGGGIIKIGDPNNDGNFTMMQFDDFSGQVFVQTEGDFGVQTPAGQRVINANFSGGTDFIFEAGDVNNITNGTKLSIIDSAQEFRFTNDGNTIFQNTTAQLYFFMNENAVVLGRNASGNNTNFSLDDTTESMLANLDGVYRWQTTAGVTKFLIDLANDRVTIASVPAFADDAAAAVGGLTTGQLYKTTTGGSTFLKIVP